MGAVIPRERKKLPPATGITGMQTLTKAQPKTQNGLDEAGGLAASLL
jgi:hypothetical protein